MLIIALVEPIFYTLNAQIATTLQIADIGGSMIIHAFGCFFGLAVTKIISDRSVQGHSNNSAVYHSDLFAMIGTLFLWMYWPSFNAAMADGIASSQRAVVNTVLSLTASCMAAFVFSYILRHEKKLK
jgi:ammonium transporter Rh